jgi:uncharacterized protein YndB with AHSA1/START domain
MPLSQIISVQIDVPVERVRAYLDEPRNFAEWALSDPSKLQPLDNGDWSADFEYSGVRHVRFWPANDQGIHDIAIFPPGAEAQWMKLRAVPEASGTRVDFTYIQRPGASEESFRSAVEWLTVDFLTLKTVLEARYPPAQD